MNLTSFDALSPVYAARGPWERIAAVSCADDWQRATRRQVAELKDSQGHRFPLRDDLWVNVTPPRGGGLWRVQATAIGTGIVGRGPTDDKAFQDWRKRMQATIERFLEMRPFEMTTEDSELWKRLQLLIDVPRYRANKPMCIRQAGRIVKKRTGLLAVKWEDGSYEKVNPLHFDESFSKYPVGQWFEAVISRRPGTHQIIRADAVRKIPKPIPVSSEEADTLWKRMVGDSQTQETVEIDEKFWLGSE